MLSDKIWYILLNLKYLCSGGWYPFHVFTEQLPHSGASVCQVASTSESSFILGVPSLLLSDVIWHTFTYSTLINIYVDS